MNEVKWIKIASNIFDNRKIRQIECIPDGDSIIVVWVKLLCLAGDINDSGMIYFTKEIPYTDQMLATQFNRPLATIQLALKTFERFGMIELIENMLHISNWEKYQNVEGMERIREQTRKRVAKHREKTRFSGNSECNVTVTLCNATDKEEEKEIEIDNIPPIVPQRDKPVEKPETNSFSESFNDFWKAYPKKVSKANALKAWNKLKPNDDLVREILSALEKHKMSSQWQKDNGQFIPYPATWINGKRWEDDDMGGISGNSAPNYDYGTKGIDYL